MRDYDNDVNKGGYSLDHYQQASLPSLKQQHNQQNSPLKVSRTPIQGMQGQQGGQMQKNNFPRIDHFQKQDFANDFGNQSKIKQSYLEHSHLQNNQNHPGIEQSQGSSKKPKMEKRAGMNWAVRTKAGCQINKMTKTNQDSAIVNPKILEQYKYQPVFLRLGYNFFAVADGHGLNGHIVSGHIKNQLPSSNYKLYLIETMSRFLKDGELNSEGLTQAIMKSFLITNREICQSDCDTNLSGSTTVSILIKRDKITSANVGDSRAVMCRQTSGTWTAIPLSIDHKPDDDREKKRIIERGGRVDHQKDINGNPIGPARVWLSYIDAPGLAMTRSFGDKVGAQAGVIAEPGNFFIKKKYFQEILEFQITDEDRFIIVASDGVWEYLTNEEIMNFIIPYFNKDNVEQAADKILIESTNAWRRVILNI